MSDIKNSGLLDFLFARAEKIAEENNRENLSAEILLLSVADFLINENTAGTLGEKDGIDKAEQALIKERFFELFGDPERIKTVLLIQINEKKSGLPYIDTVILQKLMHEAAARAEKKQQNVISADIVLECIREEPTEAIMRCLEKEREISGRASAQGADAKTDSSDEVDPEHLKALEIFRAMQASKESDKEDAAEDTPDLSGEAQPVVKLETGKSKVSSLINKVKSIQKTLLDTVYGQDNAVNVFTTGYFQAELLSLTDKSRKKPRATFLFAGSPGVGKTFLAEKAAEVLKLPFMRFDMSEYSDKEANIEFCGSDKVYKNGKEGNVTKFVGENPKCILLFDEIEKAHLNVIHLFLQMLDAGRLRDNFSDEEISFTDAIIIFTTNAGRKLYEESETGNFSGVSRKVILKALEGDVNPETGAPFFPAALCSRFASGNVVMFNHIQAHNLRAIAKREVLRHADNMKKEIGIETEFDERIFTSLLFAEGGAADARTVRARAEAFYDEELFELFRLVAAENVKTNVTDIEKVRFSVELPRDNPMLLSLFEPAGKPEVLVFAAEQTAELCKAKSKNCSFIFADSLGAANEILKNHDVKLILCDVFCGRQADCRLYLNAEDVTSSGRDFLRFATVNYRDTPIYLIHSTENAFNAEEKASFLKQGVRDTILLCDGEDEFDEKITAVCGAIHQQQSMLSLAKANKVVSFETAQLISPDGKTAEIRLFDFAMNTAIDPDDGKNILSSISKPNIRFEQVIGAKDAKAELEFFVEYLKNPKKYVGKGVKTPRGVLLYGPPGTGKTMLAKAMACESDVTFIAAEGNQFLKKYVGEGSQTVHDLFKTARKYAPSILFIDEIDAIAKERRGGEGGKGSEDTLTAFLAEMDGFKNDPSKPVFVLAATNFDVEPGHEKSLDPALMRRFDNRVYIDLPDKSERTFYLRQKLAANKAFSISDAEVENISVRSTGMSLAELESITELALRSALRTGDFKVTDEIFEEAFESFVSGETKKWDSQQLERVARHEAGHTLLCRHGGETPSYVTIVARSSHGGYMQHGDNEGKAIYTKDELLARIRTSLGGRAAEIVYYGEKDGISTGASGDLASATSLAMQILCTYGMDKEFGLAVVDSASRQSGELSAEIRDGVNKILDAEMENAVKIISEKRTSIDALVAALMEKNRLNGNEIEQILASAN